MSSSGDFPAVLIPHNGMGARGLCPGIKLWQAALAAGGEGTAEELSWRASHTPALC